MALTAGNIRLPPDSTGTKMRTYFDGTGDPSADVHRQVVTPADRQGNVPGDAGYHGGAVGGATVVKDVEFTRPADATAYAIGDTVVNSTSSPTPLTIANAARVSGGSGYVTSLQLVSSVDAALVGVVFRVWLFTSSPSVANDNAAFASNYADRLKRLPFVDLYPMIDIGNDAVGYNAEIRIPFVAAATDLFAVLETRTAFTPGNAQTFHLIAGIEQN